MTALQGFRILELSESPAGEYCGKLLADFGAEVIKVEKPGSGSPTRHMGPMADIDEQTERSGLFAYLNTNKRSVTLDLSSEKGTETVRSLLGRVDGVIDDHCGEWLAKHGLDSDNIRKNWPDLVFCSITSFGLDEPVIAEDINVFHSSGWGYHTPSGADNSLPPLKGPGRFMVSYEAALDAAVCIVASLYEREQSKNGQFIDISKQAVMASRIDYVLAPMIAGDMPVSADRRAFDLAGPSGIFPCSDGYVYLWMSAPAHWKALGELMGNPGWMNDFPEHWLERECTTERVASVRKHLVQWLANLDKHEISAESQKLGLTMVPLNTTPDLLSNEQFKFREFFQQLSHPVLGSVLYPTVPYRLSKTPAALATPAPLLGQHSEQTLATVLSSGNGGEE